MTEKKKIICYLNYEPSFICEIMRCPHVNACQQAYNERGKKT